jgi:hypothetical protein
MSVRFTPDMLTELAYFFTNTDRQTLEQAGIIQPGKAGDDKWKRYNHNFDIFILKSNPDQLDALAKLVNDYTGAPTTDVNDKTHPRFVAGYTAGLHDRQLERSTAAPIGVRCTGCGSPWDDERLAEEKRARPNIRSCCPERQMIPIYAEPPMRWLPIEKADKSIDFIIRIPGRINPINNSTEYWVRDDDGRVYRALWSDNGEWAYWWDIEAESPVDPIEFMPHPLDPSFHEAVEP